MEVRPETILELKHRVEALPYDARLNVDGWGTILNVDPLGDGVDGKRKTIIRLRR